MCRCQCSSCKGWTSLVWKKFPNQQALFPITNNNNNDDDDTLCAHTLLSVVSQIGHRQASGMHDFYAQLSQWLSLWPQKSWGRFGPRAPGAQWECSLKTLTAALLTLLGWKKPNTSFTSSLGFPGTTPDITVWEICLSLLSSPLHASLLALLFHDDCLHIHSANQLIAGITGM